MHERLASEERQNFKRKVQDVGNTVLIRAKFAAETIIGYFDLNKGIKEIQKEGQLRQMYILAVLKSNFDLEEIPEEVIDILLGKDFETSKQGEVTLYESRKRSGEVLQTIREAFAYDDSV